MRGEPTLSLEPTRSRWPRRPAGRGLLAGALAVVLSLLVVQVPGRAQPRPGVDLEQQRSCEPGQPDSSPASCRDDALDAFRKRRLPTQPPMTPGDFRPVLAISRLPNALVGQGYKVGLVVGGTADYRAKYDGGDFPRGLQVSSTGALIGVPQIAGDYEFTLTWSDSATPPQKVTQSYFLRVVRPRPRPEPRPIPTPGPIPPPPPPPEPGPSAERHVDGQFTVYVLRASDLPPPGKAAVPPPPPPPPAPQAAPPASAARSIGNLPAQSVLRSTAPVRAATAPLRAVNQRLRQATTVPPAARAPLRALTAGGRNVGADAAQAQPAPMVLAADEPKALTPELAAVAQPLINVEYPSRGLFLQALTYRKQAAGLTPAERQAPLTAEEQRIAVAVAAERHQLAGAPELNWAKEPGCACAPPRTPETQTVYGFFPFWSSAVPGPAIRFSRVTRIGFVGVQLGNSGDWLVPTGGQQARRPWWDSTSDAARIAHGHGAHLDLVVQRNDWSFLNGPLQPGELEARAEAAARGAVELADTKLRGRFLDRFLNALLIGSWGRPKHVFDGVTVMFDYPPPGAPERAQFLRFREVFVRQLIRSMQDHGRSYVLNLVASEYPSDDADGMISLLAYKKQAEPRSAHEGATVDESKVFEGTTDIRVNLLTPLAGDTSARKKALRGVADTLKGVRGYDRVAILQGIVPVLYIPAGEGPVGKKGKPPASRSLDETRQLDDDLVYSGQNFGGAALWPTPMLEVGAGGEAYMDIDRIWYPPIPGLGDVSICNLGFRLLGQFLAIGLALAVIAYFLWGQVSGRAWVFRLCLYGLAAVTAGWWLFLMKVDPALVAVRSGNWPFIVVLVLLGAFALWNLLKPKIPRP